MLADHLPVRLCAQANIHKPLLLEEFGKIVWEKDIPKGYIEKKRNPVYEAMTGVTMDSVKGCAPLVYPAANSISTCFNFAVSLRL